MDPILRTTGRTHESPLPSNLPLIRARSCGRSPWRPRQATLAASSGT